MTKQNLPCPTLLRLLISYDADTGKMTWRKRKPWMSRAEKNNHTPEACVDRFNKRYAKKSALNANKGNGYKYGTIMGKNALAHRVAWCLFYGYWPSNLIDHINGVRHNNSITNLRDVNHKQNGRNRIAKPKRHYYGLYLTKHNTWQARINVKGKNLCLGTFPNLEDAKAARVLAENKYWGSEHSA